MKGLVIVILVVLLGLGGWWYVSSMGTAKTTNSNVSKTVGNPVSGSTITIKDFAYSPGTLTVKPGEKVVVTNMDTMGHSVTACQVSLSLHNVSKRWDLKTCA